MTIRPFTFGDILLLQNLGRHAKQLHIEKNLLQPRSVAWTILRTSLPWVRSNCITYLLRQDENGLARAGLVQVEIRPDRPEADVTLLTPALDAPQGHPAIWQKLLVQATQQLVDRQINRLYCDIPDQPLLVNTVKQAGFQLYAQETVWRLASLDAGHHASSLAVRRRKATDSRALSCLYKETTPLAVQQAEGVYSMDRKEGPTVTLPILDERHLSLPIIQYVVPGPQGIDASLQASWGRKSAWIKVWADTNNPDTTVVRQLLQHALFELTRRLPGCPVYIGVRDYQSGLAPILSDFEFAPFTDRARMVRHILQWAQRPANIHLPALEAVRDALPGSLVIPKTIQEQGRHISNGAAAPERQG